MRASMLARLSIGGRILPESRPFCSGGAAAARHRGDVTPQALAGDGSFAHLRLARWARADARKRIFPMKTYQVLAAAAASIFLTSAALAANSGRRHPA
jgi:hypothetical protein